MGYDMWYHDHAEHDGEGYFRLNIWGMGLFSDAMAQIGMTFNAGEHPAWPDYPRGFEFYARKYPEDYPDVKLTPEQEARADEYFRQADAVRIWHGPETPGIPAHKFWSNDGWIVTPAECLAAVRIAGDSTPEGLGDRTDRWRDWIAFMDRAAKHGGFEVH